MQEPSQREKQFKEGHGARDPPPGYRQTKPETPSLVSWMGTCETAAPSEVLSCQKLEASLQMQSLRSFQPAVPLSYPTKYGLDDRILRQHEASGDTGRATFQQPEGTPTRDFNQFGMDSEPSSYYQRHQSNTDDHFNHLNQPSMDAPVTHFLAQTSGDPMYQHHNQFAPDSAMYRQQSHSTAGASLYRQSHLPAEAIPFCHQTQAPEQSAFQPSGPSSYQINPNQPQVDALLYQHQNQLPESALYQRQEAPVFHQSNQSVTEPPLFHQGRPTMEAPMYHQNQRPAENAMFRDPVQPVTEGPMYHQGVSTLEASLYRNQRRADASMFHQSNQATTDASMYHHANQSSGETPVFQHQDAAMFHHPNQPLPGMTQHFLHHGHSGPQQASNFFSPNQTSSDSDFFRYQNQAGDNHYQRQNQTNAAYYNLQNLAAVDAQFHHQQSQAEPSFPLHQSQRSMEPPIQNPGSVDSPFYAHRGMDGDVPLCPQNHTPSESQMYQFQNQVPQETRIHHHHSRASAPVFPYQGQVVPETQIHQQNRTSGLTVVNYQNPAAQDNRSQITVAELPLLDYGSPGSQDKQYQNTKTPEYPQYQNQGPQDLQQSSTCSGKSTLVTYQKKSRDERLYSQNQERHQFKSHQQTFEEAKQDHSKLNHSEARSSKMPHCVPQMNTRDFHTRNGAVKARLVPCKSEQNTSQYDKTRTDSFRNKAAKDRCMEQKSQHFNRNTVVAQWHSAKAQRLETNAPQISEQQQDISCTVNRLNKPHAADENMLENASEVRSAENISSLVSTEPLVVNSVSVHFNNGSIDSANNEPAVDALFVKVLSASEPGCPDNTDKTASSENCAVPLGVQSSNGNGQALPGCDGPSKNLDNILHFAVEPASSDTTISVSQPVSGEHMEVAQGPVVEQIQQSAAEYESATMENEFTATNAHLLPRPPDILLTVPADSECHFSSPVHDPLALYDEDHPSTPSAQLSQEGSGKSSPALGLLFDCPEVVDLPPTPPPTPPLSPPLLTPPCETPPPGSPPRTPHCTPPVSSAPSPSHSATPPFSSPLSTSPRSGQEELQTLCLVPWEASQVQPLESNANTPSDSPVLTPHANLSDENSNSAPLDESVKVSSSANTCLQTQEADSVNISDSPPLDKETCGSCLPSSAAGLSLMETSTTELTLPDSCAVLQDESNSKSPTESTDLKCPAEANLRDESLTLTLSSDDLSLQNEDHNSQHTISKLDHCSVQNEPSQTLETEEIISVPSQLQEAGIIPAAALANADDVLPADAPGQELPPQDETASVSPVDPIPVEEQEQQGPSIRVHGFSAPRTHPLKL